MSLEYITIFEHYQPFYSPNKFNFHTNLILLLLTVAKAYPLTPHPSYQTTILHLNVMACHWWLSLPAITQAANCVQLPSHKLLGATNQLQYYTTINPPHHPLHQQSLTLYTIYYFFSTSPTTQPISHHTTS